MIDSKQAAAALSDIEDIVHRVRQSQIYNLASLIMIWWGVLVFAGNIATWLWPWYAPYIWPAVNTTGVAGTVVIALPKVTLLSDLVERTLKFTFTPTQLQAYGTFELQVLEELLRWIPTDVYAQNVRVANEDIEMFGGLVHAGEGVLPSTAVGNRDPEVYANPDEIDLDRDLSRVGHLSFGFGPHICPGQYVARVEIQSIVRGLVKRLPSLEIEEIEWRTTSVVRGAKRLVVRW